MRLRSFLPIAAAVVLAGCIDEYENCVRNSSKDLTVVNQLINQSQTLLARGYGFETRVATEIQEVVCLTSEGAQATCLVEVGSTYQAPIAVDLEAERKKLDQLLAQRRVLESRLAEAQKVCRAQYPAES